MKAVIFLAEGFEEAEAFCPYDCLKRADIEVDLAGIGGKEITSSHGLTVNCDLSVEEVKAEEYVLAFCPGGMPGAVNLAGSWQVNRILAKLAQTGYVAAICASPAVVLAPLGLLDGRIATCYPSCSVYAPSHHFTQEGVCVDGNIITGKSAGWAFDLGLKCVELLKGKEEAEKVRASIYYKD